MDLAQNAMLYEMHCGIGWVNGKEKKEIVPPGITVLMPAVGNHSALSNTMNLKHRLPDHPYRVFHLVPDLIFVFSRPGDPGIA